MRPLRRAIAAEVHKLVASRASEGFDPRAPRADEGFFGPSSVAWRVHGDFTTMLVGGVSALLMQMLHPGALAGVWDHSDFRRDMSGRLRRTAQFLSGTTFGSTEQALALIARVRAIHDHVHGHLPDGRPYSANDPDLLAWVHVAGVWSFLQSYLRYGAPLSGEQQDRYFAETAIIAEKLGADRLPRSRAEVRDYFEEIRPELAGDGRTRTVAAALLSAPAPNLPLEPFRRLVMEAGSDLLPDWARAMHRLPSRRMGLGSHAGVRGLSRAVRWALQPAA